MSEVVWQTNIEGLGEAKRGKVRDIYDLGDKLLIVACDRISAYDHVLQPGIPGKGRILNQMSNFWFERLAGVVENHLIATEVDDFPEELQAWRSQLEGRSVLVHKAEVVPFECVARGFLAGSGYKEYMRDGTVCGIPLEEGLERASRLSEPIYTPATKAETGHDENISFEVLVEGAGEELAHQLRDLTLELYSQGTRHAEAQGLILADTKFEFGMVEGRLVLIDEVLTPDSSRYWEASQWQPGEEPVSVDKQYVRNWLDSSGWDHEAPAPELPDEVVAGTLERYREAFVRITGSEPRL
jgi:phosphoribosylaminoimidazole-succinocarboxamide synthase